MQIKFYIKIHPWICFIDFSKICWGNSNSSERLLLCVASDNVCILIYLKMYELIEKKVFVFSFTMELTENHHCRYSNFLVVRYWNVKFFKSHDFCIWKYVDVTISNICLAICLKVTSSSHNFYKRGTIDWACICSYDFLNNTEMPYQRPIYIMCLSESLIC